MRACEAVELLPATIKQIRKQFLVDVGEDQQSEGRDRHLKTKS
jgi:hypothetical protein